MSVATQITKQAMSNSVKIVELTTQASYILNNFKTGVAVLPP